MPQPKLLIGTDGTLRINGLADEDDDSVINTATITAAIYREAPLNIEQSNLVFSSGGSAELKEGDSIEGDGGGATALVTAIEIISGSWAGGNAVGKIFILNQIGAFQAEQLDIIGGQADVATIAADSTGAVSVAAGAKTKITIIDHGLDAMDHVLIMDSYNYEVEWDVDVQDDKDNITIAEPYAAEKFTGNEKVYVALRGGWGIAVATTGANGNYKGTIPDTLKKLIKDSYYLVVCKIVYGAFNIMLVNRWEAEFYKGED